MGRPVDATLTGKLTSALRRDLAAGRLRAGQALPSEGELCRKFGVSRVTVRRGLERLRRECLVESRAGVGHFVSRSVAPGAAELSGRTDILYVHDMGRSVEALPALGTAIFAGAVEEAARQGLDLFLCCLDLAGLRRAVRQKKAAALRGVLFDWNDPEVARFLNEEGVPFVVVEGDFDDLPAAAVVQDDAGGTRAALELLAAGGSRRIAYLGYDDRWVHRRRREAAFREFHLRRGWQLGEELVAMAPFPEGDGRAQVARLLALDPRPEAVYLANRELLPGLLAAAAERKLDVPRDLRVVVWGSPEPGDARPEIPCIDWDRREMGRMAVRVLADRSARGDAGRMQVLIPARLVSGVPAAAPKTTEG